MRAAARQAMRHVAARSMDTGRRVLRWLPSGSAERLREVAGWLDRQRPPPPIEDWSMPLIGAPSRSGQPHSGLLTTAGPGVIEPVGPGEPAIVHTDASAPRCLLVTGLLDVGGMDEV